MDFYNNPLRFNTDKWIPFIELLIELNPLSTCLPVNKWFHGATRIAYVHSSGY